MSQRGLEALLRPKSIAVLGASEKPGRAGFLMMRNLLDGNFNGPVLPITPKYRAVCGVLAYPNVASLPMTPDLAVICTNAERNLALLEDLGLRGCKTVIILSAQPAQFSELKACAVRYHMRLLGPNSLGLLAPWQGLNASFSPVPIMKGKLAFISQSAAVSNTILDWAQQRGIGFSYFIALGDSLDIDIDDLLDFLARDGKTSAILLHLEHISDARRFLSAARSASRNKPILVIKSGRSQQAQQLFNSRHQGLDAAYDAAIQRAGLLRVRDTHELFSAVETLSHLRPLRGERLLLVSNGAAPAAQALDRLLSRQGKLAILSETTQQMLREKLPRHIAIGNPLNLREDATTASYLAAVTVLLDSDDIDALLIIYAPSAAAPGTESAEQLITLFRQHPRGKRITLLTNWCGEFSSQEARRLFNEAGIPTYRTPEGAVTAFMHIVEYRRNQKQLMETPALPQDLTVNASQAHTLIHQALADGVTQLDTHEVQPILQAYGLNTLPTWIANDSTEAVYIAEQIGYPVAIKLRSPDIPHKSEVQGVMLYLRTAREVQQAADAILDRVKQTYPQARIHGLLVQSMANRAGAQELRIAVEQDPVFGPLIMLGEGGVEWREKQAAVALPPLNMTLARYLVLQAVKGGKIRSRSALRPLDIPALSRLLVQVSNLILDCPEISRLDIHPLLASGDEFTLLDVTLHLTPFSGDPQSRLAIRPYPQELEETVTLKNNAICLFRPILPEDEPLLSKFIAKVTKEDLYYRYFSEINEFNHEDLANMTQIDYDREMAFVAVRQSEEGAEIIGVTRAISDPDNTSAEFAVLVRSDLKGLGLGRRLLEKLIQYARLHGLGRLNGITMPHNQGMITLAKKLGFSVDVQLEEGIVTLELPLEN
ncbi:MULTISPECIES: bifunctional acetate--CoA ligase family protein/GNAT family N-acetyltransferase [unclassified Brenneria]|uniref:bifunctional acetate--CoA ligase family protein/GNAT family N-acetyltransferase n=1 Tax=unclassified Brenneria TaxID=2634434 RepID=UPI001557289C|nr:bifunctional acetate--CoA ligase family protein/GNAT family N-acetyltransferase [Brenneria sp. hezel4-2-4]MEE3652862.1 bifunctional acetate--CoA ligase family protein/GNAT family N-acetyltransferase [Brenneria sp. HEZEL_4_2_4]NPD02816.1 bifunctional acetate--CoA ligase family protein/GNAT family N-acetyltransferase [Brenneria sp. hezel4-2-4]